MTKEQKLINLYKDACAYVSEHNKDGDWQPDLGVAMDMIKHEYYAYKGLFGRTHKYNMPEGFNFDEFGKDLEKN